jgi:thymidylate synthase
MNHVDHAYFSALHQILDHGEMKENRTGIRTQSLFGMQLRFNFEEGFPILTTKRIAFESVKGELIGFIRGYTSAADFRKLGVKIWDANANQNMQWLRNQNREGEDDLGRIYGAQWRDWQYPIWDQTLEWGNIRIGHLDQLYKVIQDIKRTIEDPSVSESRRLIVTAWNPAELDKMALPPCHLFFQFNVRGDHLDLLMYQRSSDFFLGVPFNISSYSLLLCLVSKVVGLQPGEFIHTFGDSHIYENHIQAVETQLGRTSRDLPGILINPDVKNIDEFKMEDIALNNYNPHPTIKAEMAV